MKFIYFHQHFSTPEGAVGVRSYQMAKALIARGHQVTMVCGRYEGASSGLEAPFKNGRCRGFSDGIEVIELEIPYANGDDFLRRAVAFLSFGFRSILVALSEQYDVVIATSTPLTAGLPGIAAHWLRRKPFMFEVRDLWPELPKAMGVIRNPVVLWAMGVLEWLSYHSADRLVGLSPGIVDGIAHRAIPRNRIALIPNGCDLDIFGPARAAGRPAGVSAENFLVLYAGTHGIANGLDAVLNAAGALKRRGRVDVKFVLVGNGKMKAHLQRRAEMEGLDNVIFCKSVNKVMMAGLMKESDIGLQTLSNVPAFYYGTSPNKFFDYIAAGLPVLNNYPGWLAEMIADADCGVVVPPDDPEAFANGIELAFARKDRLAAMRENAVTLAQTFDRRRLADQFVDWVEGTARR